MGPLRRLRWVEGYYLATPLFALADAWFGANVRAVGLEGHPGWRAAWYAGCLGCGVLGLYAPRWARWVGVGECALNLLLLALSVFLPYLALAEGVERGATGSPFGPGFITNLLLASGAWLAIYYGHAAPAWRRDRAALS